MWHSSDHLSLRCWKSAPRTWEARTPGAAGFFGTCPSSHHMADGFLGLPVQPCFSSEGVRTLAFTPWLSLPLSFLKALVLLSGQPTSF